MDSTFINSNDFIGMTDWQLFLMLIYLIATFCDSLRDVLYTKKDYIKNPYVIWLLNLIPFEQWSVEQKLWHVIKWISFYGYGLFVVLYFKWWSIILIPIGYLVWRLGILLTGQKWDSFWLSVFKKLWKWIKIGFNWIINHLPLHKK